MCWAIAMQGKRYHEFFNKSATPYRGAPPFLVPSLLGFWTFLAISQPKTVRFSICKKPLEDEVALSLMRARPKGSPTCPAPLLGNLRSISKFGILGYCSDVHFWSTRYTSEPYKIWDIGIWTLRNWDIWDTGTSP